MKDTLATGAVASAATTAAVAALGQLENGAAAGPVNAVSHILWGNEALRTDAVDGRHTLVGASLNAAAVVGWAGLHEAVMPRHRRPSVPRALLSGVVTSAVAYFTDYHVVPKRLTPGFEERLSSRSLFAVYATLALALAAGSLMRER